jgi:hypothetical protein
MKIIIQKLNNWVESLQVNPFSKKLMFPTLKFKDNQSLQQLVILYKDLLKNNVASESMEIECKKAIIRVATFQGIIRCVDSNAHDKEFWHNEFMKEQKHFSLE